MIPNKDKDPSFTGPNDKKDVPKQYGEQRTNSLRRWRFIWWKEYCLWKKRISSIIKKNDYIKKITKNLDEEVTTRRKESVAYINI